MIKQIISKEEFKCQIKPVRYRSPKVPKPKWNICLIFKIKQKVSNELSSISRSNIRSADPISICRSNYYLEIEYSFRGSNHFSRSNIQSADRITISRSNIRSAD